MSMTGCDFQARYQQIADGGGCANAYDDLPCLCSGARGSCALRPPLLAVGNFRGVCANRQRMAGFIETEGLAVGETDVG